MTAPENKPLRLLVVDDEPASGDSISWLLAADRHQVENVTSGKEALDAFQPGKFDLVILDYEMPGMKGDKVAAAIKALSPQQPIMMITGYGEALRFAGSFPLAVDLVVGKPLAWQDFRDAVRRLAGKT